MHQLLNFVSRFGNIFHQIDWGTIFLSDNIIFNPNAKTFFRNVNSRFDCEHHIGLYWLINQSLIVSVQTQVV